jgi:hypothetical protein
MVRVDGANRGDFLNPWDIRWTVCGAPPVCGEWRRWRSARRNGFPALSLGYPELLASVAGKVARSLQTASGTVHELGPPHSPFEKVFQPSMGVSLRLPGKDGPLLVRDIPSEEASMARRGRCRCGSILTFQKGPDGYKTRCASCGAVVRLKPGAASSAVKKRSIACPCGAAVPVRSGMRMATCPGCNREFILRKKKSTRRRNPSTKSVRAANRPEALPRLGAANGIDATPASASEPPANHLLTCPPGQEAGRTVACEVCHTIVSVEARQCSGCGSVLARTIAAPPLDLEHPRFRATVWKSFRFHPFLGWLAAGAALIVIAIAVLLMYLWQ